MGIISERENFATSRNPEASCYFLVGSGWFLLFPAGHFQTLDNTAFHCIPVTQPPHVANKHIFEPSLRLVHCCTFLNS